MPLVTNHRPIAASIVPDWLQTEDDGSVSKANITALSSGQGMIQVNGVIGDGPHGSSTGDFDVYQIAFDGNITIDVDALVFGSNLHAVIEVYYQNTLLYTNDGEFGLGSDPYIEISNSNTSTFNVVIRGAGSFPLDLNDSSSGTGVGSTGSYRMILDTGPPLIFAPKLVHGTNAGETIEAPGLVDNDIVVGNGGNDTIKGLGGNDLFIWNDADGNDSVDGGIGFDVQEANASNNSEKFFLLPFFSGPSLLLGMTGGAGGDATLLLEVEGVDLRARGGNDVLDISNLSGTALTGPIRFWAGSGKDALKASAALNSVTAWGDGGDDDLISGAGADRLYGGAGSDRLTGNAGSDLLDGGSGNDKYFVNGNSDKLVEAVGKGTDTVLANSDFILKGGVSVEILRTTSASATAGIDLAGNAFANRIFGNAGANKLEGRDGEDLLKGGKGNDRLAGGTGDDKLYGDTGRDRITGGKGADDVYAGSGNDRDVFIFTSRSDSGKTAGKWDRIFQFEWKNGSETVSDKIDLSDLKVSFSDLTINTSGSHVKVSIDTGGSSAPDMVIQVMNIADLNKADFIL